MVYVHLVHAGEGFDDLRAFLFFHEDESLFAHEPLVAIDDDHKRVSESFCVLEHAHMPDVQRIEPAADSDEFLACFLLSLF